ncbi:unnamed protein product [Clonostachys byssicola]|uniref:Uncharacterized protein n=1 Tax=Clonostachys byssicola TaxID=160290 RepID=A0A9N9Y1T2_9HYPO|nr:unnamed protein product [Clonostachys byssicola]
MGRPIIIGPGKLHSFMGVALANNHDYWGTWTGELEHGRARSSISGPVPPSIAEHAIDTLIGAGPGQRRVVPILSRKEVDDRWVGKLHSFIQSSANERTPITCLGEVHDARLWFMMNGGDDLAT